METIFSGRDLLSEIREMSPGELEGLAAEIRGFLIENVSKTGGHLASNLGAVELTIALHRVFDTPRDRIVWDVGHQTYVHKILTGRADRFDTLRQFGGLSGFPKRAESEYDCFDTGHSSTSVSAAAGIAAARDLAGDDYEVIAVIGDGSMTGGLAYEALNNAGASGSKMIVILNDNGMSISRNTGSMSKHLLRLRTSERYIDFKKRLKSRLTSSEVGEKVFRSIEAARDSLRNALVEGAVFEELGFKYLGPVDGHNLEDLIFALTMASEVDGPVLIHVITEKGKGYEFAEKEPNKFHGVGPFDPATGTSLKRPGGRSYSDVFGSKLAELAAGNDRVVAVSAAMIDGTGLKEFAAKYPERTFDVGIAEEYAVSFAAGMAVNGYKPVVCVYSTFLQRAYDQMMIDVCMQGLPVVFAIDRAGAVGADGETHQGIYDLSYLETMPGMTVLTPADAGELEAALEYAVSLDGPCALRYPRGDANEIAKLKELPGYAEDAVGDLTVLGGKDVQIRAVGTTLGTALEAARLLGERGISAEVVNVRCVQPWDTSSAEEASKRFEKIVTLEDNIYSGGYGQRIAAHINRTDGAARVLCLSWPDSFIEHGSQGELFAKYGLDAASAAERIAGFVEGKN